MHCKQAISADEIKAQVGANRHMVSGRILYCVVAVRYQPKLDKNGQPERYGRRPCRRIKTEIRFFRAPNDRDEALEEAEASQRAVAQWEAQGLIPTERIPEGHKTMEPIRVGMTLVRYVYATTTPRSSHTH